MIVDGVQTAGKMYSLAGIKIRRAGDDVLNFPYSIIRRMGQMIREMRTRVLSSFSSSNRFGGTGPLYRPEKLPAPYTTRRKERVPTSILDKLQGSRRISNPVYRESSPRDDRSKLNSHSTAEHNGQKINVSQRRTDQNILESTINKHEPSRDSSIFQGFGYRSRNSAKTQPSRSRNSIKTQTYGSRNSTKKQFSKSRKRQGNPSVDNDKVNHLYTLSSNLCWSVFMSDHSS